VPQPTHLTAVLQNARSLRGNGDLAGARLMLEQGLEVAKASLGEDHPELLSAAHLLAGLHREAGEPAAARRVLEEAVAAGQLRYSDSEPLMLALSYSLGTVADELGNRHEARRNFGRLAAAGPAVLGEDHAWVRAARGYLGNAPAAAPVSGSPPPSSPLPLSPPTPSPPTLSPPTPSPPPPSQPQPPRQTPPLQAPSYQAPAYEAPTRHAPPPHQTTPYQATPYQPSPITEQRPQYDSFGTARRGRGATIAAAVAAFAAVLAASVAAVVVLTDDRGGDASPPQGQVSTAPPSTPDTLPPSRVRLADERSSVTLTWADPSDGTAPFIVAGGRTGEQQRAMGQVPAGTTRYELNGLNANLNYCFIVIAVYSTDQLAPSEQVCTERSATTARPSGTRTGTGR
jgi:hypothetical protein